MLILTLGALSWQSQAALAKPLHTDVSGNTDADFAGGAFDHTEGYAQLDRTRQIWYP